MRLTGRDVDGNDETVAITHQVDLGPEPAPRPPERMVRRLFEENEGWLAKLLEEGREGGQFRFKGPADVAARFLFSSLEGALLIARAFHDTGRFEASSRWILETLIA